MAGYPAAGTGPDATGGSEPQRDVLRGPQLPDPASDVMGGPRTS